MSIVLKAMMHQPMMSAMLAIELIDDYNTYQLKQERRANRRKRKWDKLVDVHKNNKYLTYKQKSRTHYKKDKPLPQLILTDCKLQHQTQMIRLLIALDFNKLSELGNPSIPESEGGLRLEDIWEFLHNAGKNGKARFFKNITCGLGQSIALVLERMWYIVNKQ